MDGFNLYRAIGGAASCRNLSAAFYALVQRDPVLRPLFPGKTLKCAIEEFAAFLAQLLGGPAEDAQRRWWLSLRESHLRFKIGQRERDAWMANMVRTLDEAPLEESARAALRDLFERSSAYVVNAGQPPAIADTSGKPPSGPIHREICQRWSAQLTLDQAVAAIRTGAADRAIALAEGSILQTHFSGNRSVFAALLALMIRAGDGAMLDYVRHELLSDPALTQERYSGCTLLHSAAAAGNLSIVELLLRLGAAPGVTDAGGHTALYAVANECQLSGAADVVRALVQAGANVDARDGVKRCSALHMAARRGNCEVAEALLDCGANNALALGDVSSNAALALSGGYVMTTPGALTNAGTVDIGGSNSALNLTGEYTQTAGSLNVAFGGTLNATGIIPVHLMGGTAQVDGTVDRATSASLIDQGAELFGTGDFVGNLISSGEIFPGDDPTAGELTISGTYEETGTGTLMEDIEGTQESPNAGLLNVVGKVQLDPGATVDIGALTFTPSFGQEFEFLAYTGTLTGTFTLAGTDASDFNLIYNANSVDLQWNQNTSATPEPSTFWAALGALGLAGAWKRKRWLAHATAGGSRNKA